MNPWVAVTGRVESWVKNPEGFLPVSCTVIDVEDRMEGRDGIEDSWLFTSKALRMGAGVAVHLSKLRPAGTVSPRTGHVASGPVSFAKIYSVINETIRRGGRYKNGAITLHLDANHPDLPDFLNLKPEEIPWAKRAIEVGDEVLDSPHLDLILQKVKDGSVWLAKRRPGLLPNVCMEIYLPSRGTCLLMHVNLGRCSIEQIPDAFVDVMREICGLHPRTGVGQEGIYLRPEEDRQVGVGVIGLASLLAREGIRYVDLVEAWENLLAGKIRGGAASRLAVALTEGLEAAADVASQYGMERALTIAPTASTAYRYTDSEGWTTTPEISPPIARTVERYSATFGIQVYDHHPEVETVQDVPWDVYFRLACCWQTVMNKTGKAHAISFNVWDNVEINREWLERWLKSPLYTTYYRLPVSNQCSLDKTQICSACAG